MGDEPYMQDEKTRLVPEADAPPTTHRSLVALWDTEEAALPDLDALTAILGRRGELQARFS